MVPPLRATPSRAASFLFATAMIWPKMTVNADCQNLTSVRTDPSGRIITIKNRTVCVGSMFSDQFGSHSYTPLLVNQSSPSRLGVGLRLG